MFSINQPVLLKLVAFIVPAQLDWNRYTRGYIRRHAGNNVREGSCAEGSRGLPSKEIVMTQQPQLFHLYRAGLKNAAELVKSSPWRMQNTCKTSNLRQSAPPWKSSGAQV
jgi:hypothetical protein